MQLKDILRRTIKGQRNHEYYILTHKYAGWYTLKYMCDNWPEITVRPTTIQYRMHTKQIDRFLNFWDLLSCPKNNTLRGPHRVFKESEELKSQIAFHKLMPVGSLHKEWK